MSVMPLTFEQYRMLQNPAWTFSPFWSHSPYPYPSATVTYNSEGDLPPENRLDFLHPYYRKKVAGFIVPAIAVAGIGFVIYTTWNTYFRKTKLDDSLKDEKRSLKEFWKNVQGGFLGGMAFGLFITILVSLQMWMRGLSLPKTIRYFSEKAQEASGVSNLVQS